MAIRKQLKELREKKSKCYITRVLLIVNRDLAKRAVAIYNVGRVRIMSLIGFTVERYCLVFWPEERCYSEMLESKLVEPKEATVGVVAKVKQGGKLYSGTIVAVGTRAEIEQRLKEFVGDEDSRTQDQGTCTRKSKCARILHVDV